MVEFQRRLSNLWKDTEFRAPPTILYGPHSLERLPEELKKLARDKGVGKALVVTGKKVWKLYGERLEAILKNTEVDYVVFNDIPTEPKDTYVEEGLRVYERNKCDFLIAIGGGSPIDTAKAIGILATNGGHISDYMGMNKVKKPTPPLVAIPTTAGTGSEVTKYTVITETKNNVKMLIGSPYIIPDVSVVDPLLTITSPPKLTATTGLDAFCHAIEAFVSKKAQPLTDIVALEAIRLISENLRKAWSNGEDMEARSNMALAAMLAGLAINNSSVTLIHGMSRPLGACFNLPHGLSNAVLLPVWAEFTYIATPEKFSQVAIAMGENISGLSVLEAAEKAVQAIKRLVRDLNIPNLKELNIDHKKFEECLEKMANDAIASGSPANNPRSVTKEDIIKLYKRAYNYKLE